MKYTKEQLQVMSNHSINALLAYLATGVDYTIYENQVKLLNGEASMDYCNNPNDIMPLAFKHGISINRAEDIDEVAEITGWAASGGVYSCCGSVLAYGVPYAGISPLRAIACCLILVLQEEGK